MRSSLKVLSREGLRSFVDQQSLALDREIGKGCQFGFVALSKSVHAVQDLNAVLKDQAFAVERVVTLHVRSPSWQDGDMERVLGIGGYFMRAADPVALGAWYRDCLGLDADENGLWRQQAGPTVFATFESETDYFGSRAQQTMVNFRVRDLDAMLAQLRAKGADVAEETQDMEGVGRFGWVTDPEGNRIELWQPA